MKDYRDKDYREPMMKWLRDIVTHEPWDDADLTEWADNWLSVANDFDHQENERAFLAADKEGLQRISTLKPHVVTYRHDPSLPVLPDRPHGQLHGIGFIYDEDRDDRVLVAIDDLVKTTASIVALAEHEGGLKIYTRLPIEVGSIDVCGDTWGVDEFVPYQGKWKEIDHTFMRECVAKVLKN